MVVVCVIGNSVSCEKGRVSTPVLYLLSTKILVFPKLSRLKDLLWVGSIIIGIFVSLSTQGELSTVEQSSPFSIKNSLRGKNWKIEN